MIFGYARVSTKEQNEGRQIEAIIEYCTKNDLELEERNIILDKQTGKDFMREGYNTLTRQMLRPGDTLIIKELDRLGRNKEMIKDELKYLRDKDVKVKILNIPTTLIDLDDKSEWVMDMVNNILIEVLGAIAEEERNTLRQRQREGIDLAKAEGRHLGRPGINYDTLNKEQHKLIKENYSKWDNKEITGVAFMNILDLKKNTFYKIMKQYQETL